MNFLRRKQIFFGLATISIVGGIIIFLWFCVMPHPPQTLLPTYFSYSANETAPLAALSPTADITLRELLAWDDEMFELISAHHYPDTTASRIYAYLLVAQRDAATLSYNTFGAYKGNLTSVSKEVLCMLIPDSCAKLTEDLRVGGFPTEDVYGKMLANIVVPKIALRIDEERARRAVYPGNIAKDAIGTETAGWKLWILPDRTQFRATPRVVDFEKSLDVVNKEASLPSDESKQAIASFVGGQGTKTSAGIWLEIAGVMLAKERAPLSRALLLRTNLALALADGVVMVFDSKYTVGNDASFFPQKNGALLDVPDYPNYPGLQAALAGIAEHIIGYYAPESTATLGQYVRSAKNATYWAGINFAMDNEEGYSMGKKIGMNIVEGIRTQEKE